ncbi:IS66 family transposase [Pandoraea sputorum]|uniref:IS66 family transposase n=1 Tax=Pandoraea sputorum TaxID=93222 RepID=A0A5E5BJ83_9BURK|nr:IS66 family transposase [Pandoraea sputorum]
MHFGKRSEKLDTEQMKLLEATKDVDLAAIEFELARLKSVPASCDTRQKPKRLPLPQRLPRTDIHHEPGEYRLHLRV